MKLDYFEETYRPAEFEERQEGLKTIQTTGLSLRFVGTNRELQEWLESY